MERDATPDFEILVVGGGPAGASAASFAARGGRRVLLLERERFPRFHIGESLLPASNEILGAMGVEDRGLAAYHRAQHRTYRHFRRMVEAFYDPAFLVVALHRRFGLGERIHHAPELERATA